MISLEWMGMFGPLAVDLILVIGALTVLLADVILPAGNKKMLGYGTLSVLTAALVGTFVLDLDGSALYGAYVGDGLALMLKQIFIGGGILAVLGAQHQLEQHAERRQGEYFELLLFSLIGMSLLAGIRDIIALVVCFELMGIPLYAMAAWKRKDKKSVEGALKFFLVGAISTAIMMFGLSFLVGLSGSTLIADVALYAAEHPSPALVLGTAMAFAGMAFKLGVFPFHMWVPDTYEGSTTPFVAFMSVAPKAAGVAVMVQLLFANNLTLLNQVALILLALATATIVAGNMLAINQSNIKRLLAYSGVAHIGFVLMGLITGTELGLQMVLFYLLGYLFTNFGAFLVVHAVKEAGGDDSVRSFAGLGRRNGFLSFAMLIFLLSLAGIPFVVGFWAKLYVFIAVWTAGLQWLVVLAAVVSVVGLYYYLKVAQSMFMTKASVTEKVDVDWRTSLAISLCLVFVIGMGVVPGPFVQMAEAAATAFMAG